MVRQGSPAADIGCDHGKLAASLVLSDRCPKVIAADIGEAPLESARRLVMELGLRDKIELRLTDGLKGIPEGSALDIIIAGIGADETAKIISDAPYLKDPKYRLVLAPAARHGKMRRYLMEEGFDIVSESALLDMGKCYTIIAAEYRGTCRTPNIVEQELGSITAATADGAAYLKRVLERTERIIEGQRASEAPDLSVIEQQTRLKRYIEGELNGNQ